MTPEGTEYVPAEMYEDVRLFSAPIPRNLTADTLLATLTPSDPDKLAADQARREELIRRVFEVTSQNIARDRAKCPWFYVGATVSMFFPDPLALWRSCLQGFESGYYQQDR